MSFTLVPQPRRAADLHVIIVISNPVRYESRVRLFHETMAHLEASGVTLYVVEAVFGDREPSVIDPENARHLRVRCDHEIWLKENLINLGARLVPADAKAVMWCDGDVHFHRSDWASETLEALQHHEAVQPFSDVVDLKYDGSVMERQRGFAYCYRKGSELHKDNRLGGWEGGYGGPMWHPGYAWAYTKRAWDALGGMIDRAIAGAGDHHMACSLIGRADFSMRYELHANYRHMVESWQERAEQAVRRNIGFVPGLIHHGFHGYKANRKYVERRDILTRSNFDPYTDLHQDAHGVLQLTAAIDERTRQLRDDLHRYFRQRNEDGR